MRLHLPFIYQVSRPALARKRSGNGGFIQIVRNFLPFHSEWEKRSTSKGTPQFPNGISGKLLYHLISNQNFQTGFFGKMVSTLKVVQES